MKLTVKTLQQQAFTVEAEASELVKELKGKIAKEKGKDYEVECQKLIYSGKILEDEKKLEEYNIDEKGFVVVIISKPKSQSGESASGETVDEAPATEPPNAQKEKEPEVTKPDEEVKKEDGKASSGAGGSSEKPAEDQPAAENAPGAGGEQAASLESAESVLVTGAAYEEIVSNVMAMGFSRDQVIAALRASFNNPDRAVEYLVSGMPLPTAPQVQAEAQAEGQGDDDGNSGALEPGAGEQGGQEQLEGDEEDPLAFLRSQPQFQQMRSVLQQNPQLLPAFLQQLRQSNPQLLEYINNHQEQFINMLNAVDDDDQGGADLAAMGMGGGPAGGGGNVLTVTPAERQAIERLKALGFEEAIVVQAYFACEKNENLAANFLLSQQFDDD